MPPRQPWFQCRACHAPANATVPSADDRPWASGIPVLSCSLRGAIAHLDYLEWLGIDAIWFNPCFVSPFRDAGYDVEDYLTIAPRYGTNDDMAAFIAEARRRGIRVLLDLVSGHTSVRHPWFRASADDAEDSRYIWSDRPGTGFVPSPGNRPGCTRREARAGR